MAGVNKLFGHSLKRVLATLVLSFIFIFLMNFFIVLSATAQTLPTAGNRGGATSAEPDKPAEESDSKAGGKDLLSDKVQTGVESLNKLKTTDLATFIGRAIKVLMGVVGSIALLMFVFGGIMWMTSRGNSEKTQKATKTLVWAALGTVIILASYTLVDFIFQAIG